jgi:dihydroneopterin aldolase / 2-amino-4-hydroxy-6-hydroxymethyldihydropteridine diphosphokinase
MSIAYVGMGSNLGDKEANLREAIGYLRSAGCVINKASSMYITEPWGLRDQPLFVNMAVEVEISLTPCQLLRSLKSIESLMGRDDTLKWGPRIIDLDILLFDNLIIRGDKLTVPHPLLHEREFALAPLAEIAPYAVHPILQKSVSELLREVSHDHDN